MDKNWTTNELEAAVRAYIDMHQKEADGESFTKKSYYVALAKQFGRTEKSYEYRMQNISYVYSLMGRRWISGLMPAKNVGENVIANLKTLINKIEGKVLPIKDTAGLDQVGSDLSDYVETNDHSPKKSNLAIKPTDSNKELPLKDEGDIEIIKKALNTTSKQLHNKLTNKLRDLLSKFNLTEGCSKENMFDVLVKKYDGENDLLIEVKSSTEIPDVRMAVGQLLDYSRLLASKNNIHMAVLLPDKPDIHAVEFLNSVEIGLLWLKDNDLYSSDMWLESIATIRP